MALLAARLPLDLWYDEAYMLREYVARGPAHVVGEYREPNNHILYALLLWPLRNSATDAGLRWPNLVFAGITLAFTALAARRLVTAGPVTQATHAEGVHSAVWPHGAVLANRAGGAAATAVAALGLCSMYLVHAMQLRGYGLSMALAAVLLWLALDGHGQAAVGGSAATRRRWLRAASVGLLSAAMLYTVPSNAATLMALAAAGVLRAGMTAPRAALREAATWLAGALAGLALYLPVWDDLKRHAGPRSHAAAWGDFLRVADVATRDARWLWLVAALGAMALALRAASSAAAGEARRQEGWRFATGLLLLGGPFAAQAVLGLSMPLDRSYCPALPGMAVAFGWLFYLGVAALLSVVQAALGRPARRNGTIAPTGATQTARCLSPLIVLAALLPAQATYARRLSVVRERTFAQDGYYCYFAANYHPEALVRFLRHSLRPGDDYVFLWDRHGNGVFTHYLKSAGLPESRVAEGVDRRGVTVYYAAPALAEYEDITAVSGIPEHLLRQFRMIGDFGYFRLFAAHGADIERALAPPG